MRKNPFEVLGITPEIARRLNERDLFRLVKANYRLLQHVYHPDNQRPHLRASRRVQEKAIQLNLSYEKIDLERNPEGFAEQRGLYVGRLKRGMRKVVRDLEEQVRNQDCRSQEIRDSFMAYILTNLDHQVSVLGLSNIRLGLNDVALGYNVRHSSWNIGKNYKEMEFDDEGSLFLRPTGRSQFSFVSTVRLVGTIAEDQLDPLEVLDRRPLPAENLFEVVAPRAYRPENQPFELRNSLTMTAFKRKCLPFLKADLAERRYLFSVHVSPSTNQAQFFCEGLIVKVDVR
ncbi:MAG: J domain-containing protein [Pseudomonadota bacterium]